MKKEHRITDHKLFKRILQKFCNKIGWTGELCVGGELTNTEIETNPVSTELTQI